MTTMDLEAALTREHREIDGGIEQFLEQLRGGTADQAPIRTALEALRRHIYLEEEFLFPPIREAGMTMPIMVMLREHGRLWQLMDVIEQALDEDGPRAVAEPAQMRATCEELLAQLDQHNAKEEPIIYPRAVVDLSEEARETFAQYLRTGSTPTGWVCEGAKS